MVDYPSERLDAVFQALADPTRRAMLHSLAQRERSVGELAQPFRMTLAAASKHIKALERAGLVQRSVQGRTHVCRLDPAPLHGGFEWLRHYEQFWNQRLDVLEELLREQGRAAPASASATEPDAPAPRPAPRPARAAPRSAGAPPATAPTPPARRKPRA